jgi:hypothetical protein
MWFRAISFSYHLSLFIAMFIEYPRYPIPPGLALIFHPGMYGLNLAKQGSFDLDF